MEFRILGTLELWANGRQLQINGTKRQIVLSALLLTTGRPVHLGRFVDAVWGDLAPTTARKQIRNAVSDLRGALADVGVHITLLGDGYQLQLGDSQLDAAVFSDYTKHARRLVEEGRVADAVAEFRAALALWRGPALAGLDNAALQAQVTSLNEQRLIVLEECIDLELGQGRHEFIVSELAEWVAENPLHERLAAQLMVALSRSGAPARALELYEVTRQTLKNELGVSPGPELQQIHHRILIGDRAAIVPAMARPAVWNNLPGITSHFTGRTTELRQLTGAVREYATSGATAPPIVAIDGMAGIGKTAVALHAAHELTPLYPEGQLAIDLRAHDSGHRNVDPSSALATLLHAIGQSTDQIPPSLWERCAMWRRLLANRFFLLLLDNVASSDHIAALLPGTPGCLTLVTSRHRLTGLNNTHQLTLRELPVRECRELFTGIVADDRPGTEPEATDAVLRFCGYHPLAIRIAATNLHHRPTWTVDDLATRLADPVRRLAELRSDRVGITEIFDQSYRQLSPAHQHVFQLVSRVHGPDIDVHTVADLANLPIRKAEHLLEALVDAHLLQSVTPSRYHMHELLRAYAAQLAPATSQCLASVQRVSRFGNGIPATHAVGRSSRRQRGWSVLY